MSKLNVKYLPKEDLLEGMEYYCLARNFTIGMWDGKQFVYTRQKFGDKFLDTELHWDEGAPHGTVKPLSPILTPLHERGYYRNE